MSWKQATYAVYRVRAVWGVDQHQPLPLRHMLPQFATCCNILSHVVIYCHILLTFSRDSSFGGIAALLRRPRQAPASRQAQQKQEYQQLETAAQGLDVVVLDLEDGAGFYLLAWHRSP